LAVRFLSWAGIAAFVKGLQQKRLNRKDKFLVDQYFEYLEDEKMITPKWSGFKKQDEIMWVDFCRFHANLGRLFTDIHDFIKKKEEWNVRAVRTDAGALLFSCSISGGHGKKCTFYVGIELEEYKKKPMYIIVQWHWSKSLRNKFLQSKAFTNVKQRLVRRGYQSSRKSGNDWIWKILEFEKIISQKGADRQKKIVWRFIDTALNDFKICGISRLMNRV
jgi:hypothetical protein